jgi:signal transduction histidine kinase
MAASEAGFSNIYSEELYGRLRWFVQVRWIAVIVIASASLIGPRFGYAAVWPGLFIIAVIVGLYNLFFRWRLWTKRERPPETSLRAHAVPEMALDLAALTAMAHFTGGLGSPLLIFFAIHMAIGTMLLPTRIMYIIAGVIPLGALGLYLLEGSGVFPFQAGDIGCTIVYRSPILSMITFAVSMFGIVYLTDWVASRLRHRSADLYAATNALRERGDELQHLLEEMESIERRKSHYMRISAHQLRSPLATIRTSLEVLSDGLVDSSSERGGRLIDGSLERVDDLLATVTDLLNLAKIREGRGQAEWSRGIDLKQLLSKQLESQAPVAEKLRIELVSDLEDGVHLAWGIPSDLSDAFENLISNAIKYSRPDGKVTVKLAVVNTTAVAEVSDQGIGIPEEFLGEVFAEFVRTPNAKRHAREGTGLGLAIVKEAIEAHGGSVLVKSKEDVGSTFTVELPLDHVPPQVEARREDRRDAGRPSEGEQPSANPR